MDRRQMLLSTLAAPLLGQTSSGSAPARQFYELRWFYLRNGSHAPRMLDFLKSHWIPLAKSSGMHPIGAFQPMIGDQGPSVLMISTFDTPADAVGAFDRLMQDPGFADAYGKANSPDPAFTRMDVTLLQAFAGMPVMDVGPAGAPPRIFETRTYESNSMTSLRTKLAMFNGGEIGIFKRLGMMPVFFGEAIFGRNLPSLTYMLSYESLAARERVWKTFIADEEFTALRTKPGYSDADIVSTISNSILSPLSFSQIR